VFLVQITIFHILSFFILMFCFSLACVLIFIKVKQREIALVSYTICTIFTAILIYSVFLTINQFITKASLERLNFTRNLRNETIIITGRVKNLSRFDIRKCYLYLNISNKKRVGGELFDNKNLKTAQMKNTSASYTIEIIENLPGNTYKDFNAQVPFPPSFDLPEFYHTLKCV